MSDLMKYYVYELIDSITNLPFYVGKGTGKRAGSHMTKSSLSNNKGNNFKKNIIRKMLSENNKPIIKYVFRTDDEILAYNEETRLIKLYGRRDINTGILANLTDGGVGSISPNEESRYKMGSATRGKKNSEETRKKKAEAAKNKGSITEETRTKMSIAKKDKTWGEIFGEEESEKKKKEASERASNYKHTKEAKEKISQSKKGKKRGPMSQTQKDKISASMQNVTLSEESYDRMVSAVKGKHRQYNDDGSWIMVYEVKKKDAK